MVDENIESIQEHEDEQISAMRRAYDAQCKRILAYKYVLAYLMRDCVEDFADIPLSDIVEKYIADTPVIGTEPVMPDISPIIGPSEDSSEDEGTVRFDIKFLARTPSSGRNIDMIINVEAQDRFNPGYWLPTRGLYYACRLISKQHGVFFTKSNYGDIVHVVSFWICTNPTQKFANTATSFSMTPKHLCGSADYPRKSYDLLTVVMVCLGPEPEDESGIPHVVNLLRTLTDEKTSREEKMEKLRKDFPEFPLDNYIKEELDNMSSLGQGFYERAYSQGISQGISQGVPLGMIKFGRRHGFSDANIISDLVTELSCSRDEAERMLREV